MTCAKTNNPVTSDANTISQLPDRRSDIRVQTVFRVARVIAAADEGLARIRNVSDQGARLKILTSFSLSERLTLQLVEGLELEGRIVWKEGNELGLQFDQAISCSDLLANLAAGTRSGTTRPVRLQVGTTALARSERGLRSVKVIDISQRGIKLVHDGSLTEGLHLKVCLPSGIECHGIVRWAKGDVAGVMLLEPLSVEALGSAKNLFCPPPPIQGWAETVGQGQQS